MSILKLMGLGSLTGKPKKHKSAAEILEMQEKKDRDDKKKRLAMSGKKARKTKVKW